MQLTEEAKTEENLTHTNYRSRFGLKIIRYQANDEQNLLKYNSTASENDSVLYSEILNMNAPKVSVQERHI